MIAVDIGNSRVKWALFNAGEIVEHGVFAYTKDAVKKDFELKLCEANLPKFASSIVVSCVAGADIKQRFIDWLKENNFTEWRFAETRSKQCAIVNAYKDPAKMGVDRWLAMIAAFDLCDAKNNELICVIDCGTAITLDILNAQGVHIGGLIMPGYQTMVQSLIKQTGNIESFEQIGFNHAQNSGLACSTQDAILKGCSQLVSGGVAGVLQRQLTEEITKVNCVVSGGDGQWLTDALTTDRQPREMTGVTIQASDYRPFLVLQGLYLSSRENNK